MATATNRMHRNDVKACGKKCCCFWFHSKVEFLTHFWRLFGLSHFITISCNFYVVLCSDVLNLHVWCAAYISISSAMLIFKIWVYKEFYRICKTFISFKKGGGDAHIHVNAWEHIFSLFFRTAWWIFMKLGKIEVLMVLHKCFYFLARSAQGSIQGGLKIGHRGSPPSRNFFFRPDVHSDKPNA